MHFLKHNETLESCSMVALNRLLKVSESFHGGILAIQDSNGTGPISQVFQSQLCDFLGDFFGRIWIQKHLRSNGIFTVAARHRDLQRNLCASTRPAVSGCEDPDHGSNA